MAEKNIQVTGNENSIQGEDAFGEKGILKIRGDRNKVVIGPKTDLSGVQLTITGNDCEVIVGSKCKFRGQWQVKHQGSKILIADKATGTGVKMIALEGKTISIGHDAMLSFNIEIRTSDAHALLDLETRKRINPAADVSIGSHVWVGARSTVAKGSIIPDDVVVGQGSLVNKSFSESHCVIAGTPAKVLRRGITWDRQLATGMEDDAD
ncbi:hypothetical protein [Brucella pituitosa]|uniref:hypothetical protein n=1 Tax=Brucella pituitosa TaxID=571256 RepID=UPI003F4A94AC